MKKRWFLFLPMLLFLFGCAGGNETVRECISDEIPEKAGVWSKAYTIFVPQSDTFEILSSDAAHTETLYRDPDGEATLTTKSYLAADLTSAVRQLCGFSADELQILETTRHGLPEYRFAWYREGADGGEVCRADVVKDGLRWYACVFAVKESAGGRFAKQIADTFAHWSLMESEGF